jgi:hypothetical protein
VIEALIEIQDAELRSLAMKRAADYHDTHGQFLVTTTEKGDTLHPVKALARAFRWEDTPEGITFWLEACSKLDGPSSSKEEKPLDKILEFLASEVVYEDTPIEEDSVAEEGSPTALAEGKLIAFPTFGKEWWYSFQRQTFDDLAAFTRKKNDDYTGGKGEADNPFANFDESLSLGIDPLTGLTVRILDKIQRLKAFTATGGLSVTTKGDAVEDIFKDLIGYSTIALGMIERSKHQG